MVQQPSGDELGPPRRFRERHRAARHRAFLDTARRIVNTEGQAALTMQRVTDELGTSVGGIYVYFPTKDALIAELQRDALNVLATSYALGQARLDAVLHARRADGATSALARVVATARFWITAESTLPSEIELSRRLIGDPRSLLDVEEATRVIPAAQRLLDEVRQRLDAAVAAKAIGPGDSAERAVVLISSVNGVLLASKLGSWDENLFAGGRLAAGFFGDLVAGWGASRKRLVAVEGHLAAFAEHEQFAPVPGPSEAGDS